MSITIFWNSKTLKMKKKTYRDLSKGKAKNIKTKLDFCKVFDGLSVEDKMLTIRNIEKTIATGCSPKSEIQVKPDEMLSIRQLQRWCTVNLFIGSELCPPEMLNQY